MLPKLWIAYDFVSTSECLAMLDKIVDAHPSEDIVHEIGRPTILAAALEGVPIVREFRDRLDKGQILVADFKGFDVPYSAEGKFYYKGGADMITVMATAPDDAIKEAIDGAREDGKLVAFDLMSDQDDDRKIRRAHLLVGMGATLISCHTGWSEQAMGKTPHALIERTCEALSGTDAQVVAMGGLTPSSVELLSEYARADQLYGIVAGSSITRDEDPNSVITQFQEQIAKMA